MYSNIFSSEIRQQNRTITKLISLQKKILQSLFQSFNMAIISYTKQNIIFLYFLYIFQVNLLYRHI